MKAYFPKKLRPWAIMVVLIRSLIYLLKHWWLVGLIALWLSPIAPHVMISYHVEGTSIRQNRGACEYLGLRGIVHERPSIHCPVIALIRYPTHY